MRNDTAVYDAFLVDPTDGSKKWIGRMGTRRAIMRDGFAIDPPSLAYCPHEWLDERGYIDIERVRAFPLMFMV